MAGVLVIVTVTPDSVMLNARGKRDFTISALAADKDGPPPFG